jgi:hypothetical protein
MESVVSLGGGMVYIVTIPEDVKIGHIVLSLSNTESHELIKRSKQSGISPSMWVGDLRNCRGDLVDHTTDVRSVQYGTENVGCVPEGRQ